jgi:hypothetical protein
MKRILLTATAIAALLLGLPTPAHADAVNNLSISVLPNPVPQSISDPCIICATNVGGQPAGIGFNNFDSTGNDSSFNLFSSNITGSFANGDDINVTPYTSGQLRTFLQALGDNTLTFGVAIDVNSTGAASEVLTEFRLIDLDLIGSGPLGSAVLFDLSGSIPLPDIRNGNGKGDYLISGFDLSAVSPGDHLLFQATWDHAVDGGESFYIVPIVQQIDVPEPGSLWMLGSMLSIGGIAGWWQRRRRHGTV